MNEPAPLTQTDIKQRRASDPKASAFVSANAGSGKTYVLVRRILRLLVEGVDPSRILALTYTTAAAANMSNRVFKDLSDWVRLDDADLARELQALDGKQPDAVRIRLVRQLFARAIGTPGGLKIQTIHAFCERVLHLFPFEANVPAGFDVLDEDRARALLEIARNKIIHGRVFADDQELAAALRFVADEAGESQFDGMIRKTLRHQTRIRSTLSDAKGLDAMIARVAEALGVTPDETSADCDRAIYSGRLSDAQCQSFSTMLMRSDKSTDQKLARSLSHLKQLPEGEQWFDAYSLLFFKADGDPRADSAFGTKFIQEQYPDLVETLLNERERLARLVDRKQSVLALERTRALIRVAHAIITAYEAEKARMGVLDFSDLVERTRLLLKRTSAQWVLYKLDQGIDHLLIDEAQDTSPEQWDVLERLTEEFFSGEGARSLTRTVFAVGDPKQSIYSFQGADPKKFSEYRDRFGKRVTALSTQIQSPHIFHREELTLSFRSVPDVLHAVDSIFSLPAHYEGLDRDPEPTRHESMRLDAPGLVEIWNVIRKEKIEYSENWLTPVDRPDENAPSVELARRIAAHIAQLVDPASSERIEEKAGHFRAITPGDILILVRKRGVFFETMIRALKDLALPVAGADRLKLASHIAVMDLVALGQSILTPDDDLTLATVLKSPLIGLNEDDLLTLGLQRSHSLYAALMMTEQSVRLIKARTRYLSYQDAAKRLGPYGFYAFVLGPGRGRARFRIRLGQEAEDAIDEFLRLALEHDHGETPSLTAFLAGFSKAEREVKRDMEGGRNEIRVMTVHGAKGLEAPIVYLPDTCGNAVGKGLDPIFDLDEDQLSLLWVRAQKEDSAAISAMRDEMIERVRREHRRLLYVALTRARDRLYIAGYAGERELPEDCWYRLIDAGLSEHLVEETDRNGQTIRRLQRKPYPADITAAGRMPSASAIIIPDWLTARAPMEEPLMPPLKPSSAMDAADRSDRPVDREFARLARQRGTLIHALLELLPDVPDARRDEIASAWLQARAKALDADARHMLVRDALALIRAPDLADLFGSSSRAEAPLVGLLKRDGRVTRNVSGQVDRLAVLDDEVIIADYKTAARTPSDAHTIPDSYIAQLAAYRALITTLYPDKKIRCLLIYTAGPKVFEINPARLDASLARIA